MTAIPLPEQFEVNEAWIAFKLNTSPVLTEKDGDFNCFSLMDAASGFILSTSFVSVLAASLSPKDVAELMGVAHGHHDEWPKVLFIPVEQELGILIESAERLNISVRRVPEAQLDVFVRDAKEGFNERFGGGNIH